MNTKPETPSVHQKSHPPPNYYKKYNKKFNNNQKVYVPKSTANATLIESTPSPLPQQPEPSKHKLPAHTTPLSQTLTNTLPPSSHRPLHSSISPPSMQLAALPEPPSRAHSFRLPSRTQQQPKATAKRETAPIAISDLLKIEISKNTAKPAASRLPEELVGASPDIMKEVITAPTEEVVVCECGKKFSRQLTEAEADGHRRSRYHLINVKAITSKSKIDNEARAIPQEKVLQTGTEISPAIMQFYEEVRPTKADQAKRELMCKWLENNINTIYPGSSVLLFGSSACNLYFKHSDVDLCLLLGADANKYNQWAGSDLEKAAIIRIAKQLRGEGLYDITKVLHSRVPILKKTTAGKTGFAFDMCVDHPLGLFNSNLIAYYMKLDGRVAPLLFVLKQWSKSVGINDSQRGRLSSYCINCMLLYFLQTRVPAVIPNLQAKPGPPVMINGYDCAFERMHAFQSNNKSPVGVLLLEFFYYYGFEFDFNTEVVSIKMARDPPPKKRDPGFGWNTPICVQDPFETDFNLSRNITTPILQDILFQFQTAYIDLCNMKDLTILWEAAE